MEPSAENAGAVEGEWLEADPTPADDYAVLHAAPPPGLLDQQWEAAQARLTELRLWVQLEAWPRLMSRIGAITEAVGDAMRERPVLVAAVGMVGVLLAVAFRSREALQAWWRSRRFAVRWRSTPSASR